MGKAAYLDKTVGGMIQHDGQQVAAGLCSWSPLEVRADQTNPTQLAQKLLAQLQTSSRLAGIACVQHLPGQLQYGQVGWMDSRSPDPASV